MNKLAKIESVETGHVLLACPYTDDSGQWIESELFVEKDIFEQFHTSDLGDMLLCGKRLIPNNSDEILGMINELRNNMPQSYAYEFSEWSEILGYTVNEDNIARYNKNAFIASILWEMTFNGMNEESQVERREELKASADEVERLMQLPEEEREKHFVSFDDVLKQWEEEYPELKDTRTEEEKEADMLQVWKNSIECTIGQYGALKAYVQSLEEK